MATNSQIAFNPQGLTVAITAASSAPTCVQALVYNSVQPRGQFRIINSGSVTVHLGVGATAASAAANAVAAASGSPAAGIPLVPGAVEILRFTSEAYFSAKASENTTLYITPGTGL
jgi:hypothetical protein